MNAEILSLTESEMLHKLKQIVEVAEQCVHQIETGVP